MKSPTSLIRFRNAVGVVLALSAIFAVVISAVTFTQDRALAEHGEDTHVTVSLSFQSGVVDADDNSLAVVDEDGSDVLITVTLGEPVPSGTSIDIPLTVEDGTAMVTTDYTVPDQATDPVSISQEGTTDTFLVTLVAENPGVAESQESLTVSLGQLPDGYTAGSTSTLTITINDGDNTAPDQSTPVAITGVAGTAPKVGETLTADTSGITDEDNDDNAMTEAVDDAVALVFTYQWTTDADAADNAGDIEGETSSTYELTAKDVGTQLTVKVTSADQFRNGDDTANDLTEPAVTSTIAHNEAKPLIQIELDADGKLNPGDVLGFDTSGMSSTMINGDGNLISGFDEMGAPVEVMTDDEVPVTVSLANNDVTYTWHRKASGDADSSPIMDMDPPVPITVPTYVLTNDDVAKEITVVASYVSKQAVDENLNDDPPVQAADAVTTEIESDSAGTVFSTDPVTGQPTITGTGQVGQTLTADITDIGDGDGIVNVVFMYQWMADGEPIAGATKSTYELTGDDVGKTISVVVSFMDDLGDPGSATSEATITIAGSPGEISRIEPGIRGVTVSAGDNVMLAVDVYGLQDAKDNGLGGTFEWTQKSGDNVVDLDGSGREINYTAPDSPGTYTIVASLAAINCDSDDEDACSAEFKVQVRRPSADGPEQEAPANPPGEIPSILADSDGNQYEVFTPVEGGTFTGEGYSLTVDAGAVPNGEFLGIRMSDEGAASNLGMTHQRYTLGGNMYAISAVDSSQATISSYVLDDPALACVPLPDELRSNISDLALVAINSDGSLTILAAQVRIRSAGNIVCGALSNLPASVAVGSSGAPAAIPTPTPEPTAVPPPTGGTAPASSMVVLWSMLLGIAVFALGSVLVIARRREGARNR